MVPAGLVPLVVILAASGALSVYQVPANTAFVAQVPAAQRAQAFGLANAGLIAGQGVMFIVAGAAAQATGAIPVIVAAGGTGAAVALLLWARWQKLGARRPGSMSRLGGVDAP